MVMVDVRLEKDSQIRRVYVFELVVSNAPDDTVNPAGETSMLYANEYSARFAMNTFLEIGKSVIFRKRGMWLD
jgi:hypothetical protein